MMIRQALEDVPHGHKTGTVKALAAQFGVCDATIYRHADLGGADRPREPEHPEYREWTRIAVALAHKAQPPVALDLAIRSGIASGELPAEAASMPVGTAHRIKREKGLVAQPRRTQRMFADYPMQAIQFDASHSTHLTVVERIDEDDWLLKLHRKPTPAGGYKNKPLPAHRLRLVPYGLWDMCTGAGKYDYTVSRGENSLDSAITAIRMLTRNPAMPYLYGIPDDLWCDQGVMFKARASRDLMGRLGTALVTGEAYRKERMGGVERGWRTLWSRFERPLYLPGRDTITLSDLRERLAIYTDEMNRKKPSRTLVGDRVVNCADAWTALMSRRPVDHPLRELPDNALATLHREAERVIDRSGIVRWDGVEYECAEWHNRRVLVRQALTGGDSLTLEDPATGERSTARPLKRRAYGEVRGIPATALDHLLDAESPQGADLYTESRAATPANVMPLVARAAPAAELDNPLDAGAYPDIHTAMADFLAQYPWPLSGDDRQAVADHLVAAGLRRETVRELASSLLNAVTEDHL